MITVNSSPNGNTAIANLIIIPGAINGASSQSYGLAVNAGGKPVLMHDCVFYTTNSNPYNYDVRWGMNGGVIWHCTFDSLAIGGRDAWNVRSILRSTECGNDQSYRQYHRWDRRI